jgi:hypothetical protein
MTYSDWPGSSLTFPGLFIFLQKGQPPREHGLNLGAKRFPELSLAEFSVALQTGTAQAERKAARQH